MSITHASIIDAEITNNGKTFLLTPLTELASEWMQEHLPDAPVAGRGVLIFPRQLADTVGALRRAGLNIDGNVYVEQ